MYSGKGSVRIDVILSPSAVVPEFIHKPRKKDHFVISTYFRDFWEFVKEDKHRVAFSLKAGLAVMIVSLLLLISQPYEVFSANIIYAVLTVIVMFEYTVGATLIRGFNRASGSLLAGICALIVIQIILVTSHAAEPYIIGVSIFLIAVVTSLMKLWPPLVPYEHCFRVILFTYCLLIDSAYRNTNPVFSALSRLYCIGIGAAVAVLVNVLVFPIWAGEQLHKELIASFHAVADSLQGCVKKYLNSDGSENIVYSQSITDDFPYEPSFQNCRAIMDSSARIDFLANSAKWEPPHGRFRLFYPWSQYVKVVSILRHCAYEVMALHGCLQSEIQAMYCMKLVAEPEIHEAAHRATELLRQLANNLSNMEHNPVETIILLKSVHNSMYQLQESVEFNSILFATLRNNFSGNLADCYNISKTDAYANDLLKSEENIEIRRGKEGPQLHQLPSIEDQEMEVGVKIDSHDIFRRAKYLESMEALSFGTFVSLLIKFVSRLDYLVDSVDELSKLAKFKDKSVV
ncbi:hypothetical protein LUZ61_014112 [Rhynchospora tenuis]|uniref:Uncharacterized protein n=1 Tax=Rhynchospora tenuis TaxID=198213 RepID=A0AAD5WDI2_9POAL|nr:hypothetical protein LUZ61_014112 [Rhynchospora tenuis]